MKRIILSLSMLAFAGALIIGGTGAFFSDTETSTGNTFTAGAIDLKIDSSCTYNGVESEECGSWELKDLIPTSDKFFNFSDVKPGDEGTSIISLHVDNNDAWVCAAVSGLASDDNGLTEPESDVDSTGGVGEGELDDEMLWSIWRDDNNNGILDGGEVELASGTPTNGTLALYDSTTGSPLAGESVAYLGVAWTLPDASGNETQTDSLTGDISFSVVQSRNNDEFVCGEMGGEEPVSDWVETSQTEGDANEVDGVLELVTIDDNNSRVRYTNTNVELDVADVTSISYDSEQVSAIDMVNGNASMRLFLDLDGVGDDNDVEIVYEPYYNIAAHNSLNDASIQNGVWQTWETTLAEGNFWANGGFLGSTPNGGAYATNFTLGDVLAAHPNAKIVEINFGMGTWNRGQVVLVDNVDFNGTMLGF